MSLWHILVIWTFIISFVKVRLALYLLHNSYACVQRVRKHGDEEDVGRVAVLRLGRVAASDTTPACEELLHPNF